MGVLTIKEILKMRVKDVLLPDGWHYETAIILILAVCSFFLREGGGREGGKLLNCIHGTALQ